MKESNNITEEDAMKLILEENYYIYEKSKYGFSLNIFSALFGPLWFL